MFNLLFWIFVLSSVPNLCFSQETPRTHASALALQEKYDGRNGSLVRSKRSDSIAVFIPKDADEVKLLGIPALKGVPKQVTLTVIQLNNVLASLGLAQTLFIVDKHTLIEIIECIAYCYGNEFCLAAANLCNPASLDFIICLENAGNLVPKGYGYGNNGQYPGLPDYSASPIAYPAHNPNSGYPSGSDYFGISNPSGPNYGTLYGETGSQIPISYHQNPFVIGYPQNQSPASGTAYRALRSTSNSPQQNVYGQQVPTQFRNERRQ